MEGKLSYVIKLFDKAFNIKRLIFGYGVTTTTHIHHLRRLPYTNVITKMQEKIKALPNNFEYLVMQRN